MPSWTPSSAQDPEARVACESFATTGLVTVMGEITTTAYVDMPTIVRDTVRDIGYTRAKYGFDAETCGVVTSIKGQSPDIAQGVDKALEAKRGEMTDAEIEAIGAGDQGMMTGFACTETPELMPLTISLAHKLCKQLAAVRKCKELPYLRPDGKSQVTVEYTHGKPKRVDTVVIAAQHDAVTEHEPAGGGHPAAGDQAPSSRPSCWTSKTKYYINATGRFVIGGPMGDTGLTGRKIIVDTYGGVARHGGGCFSGKDPTKVDRSGVLRGALRGQERGGRGAGRALRAADQLRHRRGQAALALRRDLRHGQDRRRQDRGADQQALRPPAGGHHPRPAPAPAHLPGHGGLRPLWPHRHRRAVGEHRQGGDSSEGSGPGLSWRGHARPDVVGRIVMTKVAFDAVVGWEQLPAGFTHLDVSGLGADSQDRVYVLTRKQARVIVYSPRGQVSQHLRRGPAHRADPWADHRRGRLGVLRR